MNLPDVSVVLCTRNRAGMLEQALSSLCELETDGFTFEIVVVDNGSTDHTAAVVQSLSSATVRINYVFEARPGVATARNRGVAAACGGWIAFFDDDQLADRRWLIELLAAARTQRARCVGGKVELKLPGGCERRLAPVCRMLLGGTVGSDELRRYTHRVTPGTGNLLVHRSVFDEIGRFNEEFNQRGEDTDLFLRMLAAGIDGWYTPRAVVHHIIPAERLEDAWFLHTAWRTAEGIACDEQRAWGPALFPFVWMARVVQAVAVLVPRWLMARVRDREHELAARCRLAIARRHLREGFHLLVPRNPFRRRRGMPAEAAGEKRRIVNQPAGARVLN
jgi:GT2 family glycosyltransferase